MYKMWDLAVATNIPFPELPVDRSGRCDGHFELLPRECPGAVSCDWYREFDHPDGTKWLSLARVGPRYLLRFAGIADFILSADGKRISCFPGAAVPNETVRHLFLHGVMPFVLSCRGELAFHASVAGSDSGAIAFFGESGAGKSTLCVSLTQQGLRGLADDCLLAKHVAGRLCAVPAYPGFRLWPDMAAWLLAPDAILHPSAHYSSKAEFRLDADGPRYCTAPLPLRRLYVLNNPRMPASETTVKRLSPRDALVEMVGYSYVLEPSDRRRLRHDFARFSHIAGSVPFRRLSYPRSTEALPAVCQAILRDLEEPDTQEGNGGR
jgi:hypothetical protein